MQQNENNTGAVALLVGAGNQMDHLSTNDRNLHRVWTDADGSIQLFIYLQGLDYFTTLLGFRVGASEASPFISFLMHTGPAAGVLLSKVVAVVLAGICVYLQKSHLLRRANYWYAALIVWNLFVICQALSRA